MADEEFDQASSGASQTYPQQCSALRKSGYVVIKGRPCKITEMSTSKTGKHGHAKVHLVALDIFTGKKYEDICPSTHNMNVPHVYRKDFQIIGIDDESYVTLMDDSGDTFADLCFDDGFPGGKDAGVKQVHDSEDAGGLLFATVLEAMGEKKIVALKSSTK